MANEDQLAILKQGVDVWNKWRNENPEVVINFRSFQPQGNFLRGPVLQGALLNDANLASAKLFEADFKGSDLRDANLREADLRGSNLSGANLQGAKLHLADLRGVNLNRADLSKADLRITNLLGAQLLGTNLSGVQLSYTIFAYLDLSEAIGLSEILHLGPSTIGAEVFVQSKGKIPEIFLNGCGLSDWEIEIAKLYNPNITNEQRNEILYRIYGLHTSQAIQISPLFISYSHGDSGFVNKIGDCLTKKGIRYWRDIHDLKAGRIEQQIDRAITQNRTVLLVLSENSLKSDWVQHEVRMARDEEKRSGSDVLCPIALDSTWNSKDNRWPRHMMEQIMEYNILDFAEWQDDSKFEGTFRKLIDGLELFYKK
jgi:hypothetical protein